MGRKFRTGSLLLLALCGGCRGDVVGELALPALQAKGTTTVVVKAGQTYRLWERYKYDTTGWRTGPKRNRCYRWRLLFKQQGDTASTQLSCEAFNRSGCTSSGNRTSSVCRLNGCESDLKFPHDGPVTIEAEVVEGRCDGGRSFSYEPKIEHLQLQLLKP